MLRAKSRLAAKRFRSRAGAGFMDRAPAGHKGLAPKSKADREAVAKAGTFWHRWPDVPAAVGRPEFGCGCSSGVEHDLAKVGVEGSNPFARSNIFQILQSSSRTVRCCDLRGG